MIQQITEFTPFTSFCIYTPCMLINDHTTPTEVNMQIQNTSNIILNNFSQEHACFSNKVTPISNWEKWHSDSKLGNRASSSAQKNVLRESNIFQGFCTKVRVFTNIKID